MTAEEIVLSFIASLALGLRALRSKFDDIRREGPTAPLVARAPSGEHGRSGRIEGMGTYRLHGRGCLLEFDSGEEVDFDWDEDGRAIFDAWRLREFAVSLGVPDVDENELSRACKQLTGQGLLEEAQAPFYRIRA